MVEFQVNSSMGKASASLKREGKTESITITKTLYEKEIGVRWMNSLKTARHYKINKNGHLNRYAEIYKRNALLGSVKTELGLSSYVQVSDKEKPVFELRESKNPFKREFDILKEGEKIGSLKLSGVHVPLVSRLGKGVHGYYNHLSPAEEELLVASLISLGV